MRWSVTRFAEGLFRWTQALHEATGGKLIGIDGKTLRRSFARKSEKAMLHLVTAWASDNGLTLGQVACEEKSNEITAIPELLKLLSLKGCTVTIDAMGCEKEIAAQIRDQRGHYVLALKGNQSGLQEDMQQVFEQALDADFKGVSHDTYQTTRPVMDEPTRGRATFWKSRATIRSAKCGGICGRSWPSHPAESLRGRRRGKHGCTSARIRRAPSSWGRPFVGTGASRTASTGYSICALAKTSGDSRIGMAPPTSPPCDAWWSACCGRKRQTSAAPRISGSTALSTPLIYSPS